MDEPRLRQIHFVMDDRGINFYIAHMKILLGMALAVIVGWSAFANDKITSVEINGRQYTNINEVYVGEGGKIIIVSPSIEIAVKVDDIPTNFLDSWNINAESRKAANEKNSA